jgi:hypothetical protein
MLEKLFIKMFIKLDRMQQPYWCGLIVKEHEEGGEKKESIMMEVIGNEVLDINNQKHLMDQYERVFVRIAKELAKYTDQKVLFSMFIHNR